MGKRSIEDINGDIFTKTAELMALFAELKALGTQSFGACRHCGAAFAVGKGHAGKRRQFCSDACRVAANRQRAI